MKTRSGFVSNSSSSSFVVLGINLEDHDGLESKYFYTDDGNINGISGLPANTKLILTEDGAWLGWKIAGGDECDFDCVDAPMEELVKYANEFESVVGVKPKLHGGMRYS